MECNIRTIVTDDVQEVALMTLYVMRSMDSAQSEWYGSESESDILECVGLGLSAVATTKECGKSVIIAGSLVRDTACEDEMMKEWKADHLLVLYNTFVHPLYRGHGLQLSVMQHSVQLCRHLVAQHPDWGTVKLVAGCHVDNQWSRRNIKAAGFEFYRLLEPYENYGIVLQH